MSNKNSSEMVINYVPGEECRVALVEDGRLEELHAERMDNASHVGNIYVGKVVNVEPGIQAAFVDFGLEANGFLHVTDLHPRYFPGEDDETTERVGKKTPRRERPPIQACLRRGQEIAVQVLKEGVGTKGPTVTSYLSIPGRFLVMMPLMDKVGVSRKVEDEETRRKMREILDQLDLPEGFGFILRTAGMDRGKMELKRDLAYLQRLWKDMEKRWKTGNKPRLLYSESDLLVRALRDILTTDISRVVIDNEQALNRAARFLKIVAPRSSTRLVRYTGKAPVFHAMGIEQQIQMIHAREVPLPGGGRLVIDETEALVAIDVNSGKMRDARDAETTAYRTNMEAADEIARQLRLRDVGGVIVNDFIDMRSAKHRRDLETRFKDNLKKDRARTTTAPVSPFGVIEMTRQRMRGSHESVHFAPCPTCRGRGLLQKPDSVAGDGLRELQAYLSSDRVWRVELVVNPRIAGELLSSKRRALMRIERAMDKRVDVRVSEAIPLDRVSFYAYDERGADIDLAKLRVDGAGADQFVAFEAPDLENWAEENLPPEELAEPVEDVVEPEPHPIELDDANIDDRTGQAGRPDDRRPRDDQEGGDRRGRRRRRGGRGRNRGDGPRDDANRDESRRGAGAQGRGPGEPSAAPSTPLRLIDGQDPDAGDGSGEGRAIGDGGGDGGGGEGAPGEGRRRRRRRGGRGRGRGGRDGREGPGGGEMATGTGGGRDARNPSDGEGDRGSDPQPWNEPELDQRDTWRVDPIDAGEAPEPGARVVREGSATDDLGEPLADSREGGEGGRGERSGTDGGEQGPGDGRRKRRRGRRGGRGRRRREGGEPGDRPSGLTDALEGMTSPTREMDENRAELSDGFDDEPPPSGFEGSDDQDRSASGGGDYDSATSGEGARESDGDGRGPADGQGDEGRRRRRRRGGRGRGRRDQGQPGGGRGPDRDNRGRENRGGGHNSDSGRERGPNRPSRPPSGQGGQAPAPPSRPSQAPASLPPSGPRTLYGGARRKLSPGELRTRPKED